MSSTSDQANHQTSNSQPQNQKGSDVDAFADATKKLLNPRNVERKIVYMFVVVVLIIGIIQLVLIHDQIKKHLTQCSTSSIQSFTVATLSIQFIAFVISVATLFKEFKESKFILILCIATFITWTTGTILWLMKAHLKSRAGAIATQSLLGISSLFIALLLFQIIAKSEKDHRNHSKENNGQTASQNTENGQGQ